MKKSMSKSKLFVLVALVFSMLSFSIIWQSTTQAFASTYADTDEVKVISTATIDDFPLLLYGV